MRNKILFGEACSLLSRSALQINAALMDGHYRLQLRIVYWELHRVSKLNYDIQP